MSVQVLVLKESAAGEKRVAATPETVKKLAAAGAQVAVESGAGLGAGITDQAYLDAGAQLAGPDSRGVADLVLLTTTAAPFFAKRGYTVIERRDAPAPVQHSAEFATICPASATCMLKRWSSIG